MFNFIRRHQIIALVFMGMVIISFVVFFSPNVRLGAGPGAGSLGAIHGKQVSREDFFNAQREIWTVLRLQYGPEADRAVREMNINVEHEAYDRLLLRQKMRDYNIEVTNESVRQWLQTQLGDPENGQVNVPFLREQLGSAGLSLNDLERFARIELGRQRLMSLLGMTGQFVTPQEAETLYRRTHRPMDADVIFLTSSDYLDQVEVTEEALADYFQRNAAIYRLPEQRRVSYVRFERDQFLETGEKEAAKRMSEMEAEIRNDYERRPEQFTDEEDDPLSVEEVIEQVRTELVEHSAWIEARRNANAFVEEVMNAHQKSPQDQQVVEKVAQKQGLEVEVTPPFDPRSEPEGMALPMEFRRAAFNLRPTQPYTLSPVLAGDTVYVIGLHEIIPSRPQPLEDVRDRVVEDFRRSEAMRLTQMAAEELSQEISGALAEGASYEAIGEERQLDPISVSFSMNTQSLPELEDKAVSVAMLQNAARNTEVGQVSDPVRTRDGAFVLVLHGHSEVNEEQMQEEFPQFLAEVRSNRQQAAFLGWLQEQRQHIRIPQPEPEDEAFAR